MTPLSQLNYFQAKTGRLIIASAYSNNITQTQMRNFKKWAKKAGWKIKRTKRSFL